MKNILMGLGAIGVVVIGFIIYNTYNQTESETVTPAVVETKPAEETLIDSTHDLITVTSPVVAEAVDSPLEVSGQARGYWFFEASAPVVVKNVDGLVVGEGYIEAQGNWMTEEFVSFAGEITYQQEPETESAASTILFMKANPSGLPENDDSFAVSVQLEDNSN